MGGDCSAEAVCMWSRVEQQKRSKCGKAVEEQGPPKATHFFSAERLCTGNEEFARLRIVEADNRR